jgi:hypothetical protein
VTGVQTCALPIYVVYEKNLGPKTAKIASTMVKYDPDQTWKKVEKKFLSASN